MNQFALKSSSPCVRNCCLDDDDTCLGCFRSLEEIKEWSTADDARRKIILDNAKTRGAVYDARRLCR